jgi:antitoxin YefM
VRQRPAEAPGLVGGLAVRVVLLGSRRTLDEVGKLAILIAMSLAEQLPLAEVKNRLSEVVEQVETQHARVTITKHGRPAAVVMSVDDLDSLEETLRVLSDPALLAQVRASRAERDQAVPLTKEEAARRVGLAE